MVLATSQRRFRLSIRTLMIAVALCALLLTPLVWMLHRVELLVNMERLAAENARAQAERALYRSLLTLGWSLVVVGMTLVSKHCRQETVFNSFSFWGTTSRSQGRIRFPGKAENSNRQKSCSGSCPKKPTDCL